MSFCFVLQVKGGIRLPEIVDKNSIHTIIDEYSPMVYRIAYQNTKDGYASDDISQNVFIKLFQSKMVFESKEHLKAWLIRVTINELKSLFRSSHIRLTVPLPEDDTLAAESIEDDYMLFEEIMKLKESYKNVIYLHYYEGYTVPEIAKILEKKENTISTWLRRAKTELAKVLKEEEI